MNRWFGSCRIRRSRRPESSLPVDISSRRLMPVIRYQEFIPHTVLQDYVKRFWILEKEYTAKDSVEEVTPDACIELILNFGSAYVQVDGAKRRELPGICLVGLQSQPLRFEAKGVVKI